MDAITCQPFLSSLLRPYLTSNGLISVFFLSLLICSSFSLNISSCSVDLTLILPSNYYEAFFFFCFFLLSLLHFMVCMNFSRIVITSHICFHLAPGFPGGSEVKAFACLQCRRPGFESWVGKIPWRRKWQPTPVFLPGESHGWRSLVGYSPQARKESDMTERLHFSTN